MNYYEYLKKLANGGALSIQESSRGSINVSILGIPRQELINNIDLISKLMHSEIDEKAEKAKKAKQFRINKANKNGKKIYIPNFEEILFK